MTKAHYSLQFRSSEQLICILLTKKKQHYNGLVVNVIVNEIIGNTDLTKFGRIDLQTPLKH